MKALLIIIALSGIPGAGTTPMQYTVDMPSMKECLDARVDIIEQDPSLKTLCIPRADDIEKMRDFFGIVLDMIDQLKSIEVETDPLGYGDFKKETG